MHGRTKKPGAIPLALPKRREEVTYHPPLETQLNPNDEGEETASGENLLKTQKNHGVWNEKGRRRENIKGSRGVEQIGVYESNDT